RQQAQTGHAQPRPRPQPSFHIQYHRSPPVAWSSLSSANILEHARPLGGSGSGCGRHGTRLLRVGLRHEFSPSTRSLPRPGPTPPIIARTTWRATVSLAAGADVVAVLPVRLRIEAERVALQLPHPAHEPVPPRS